MEMVLLCAAANLNKRKKSQQPQYISFYVYGMSEQISLDTA